MIFLKYIVMWQCRKSVPPKSFTFTLRDRGGVSQLTGRKEDIRKRVVPERFCLRHQQGLQ